MAVYSEQVYWTDAGQFLQDWWSENPDTQVWSFGGTDDVGYGTKAPTAPPDNQVFSYLYVLAYYLRSIFILMAVGESFFADFGKTTQRQQDAIISFANLLTTIHNLIAGGITKLTPAPPPTAAGWVFRSQGHAPIVPGITFEISAGPVLTGIAFEWGAVELFSGFNSIKSNGFPWPTVPWDPIFQKIQIRALRELISVYAGVGLPTVWTVINGLNKITGQAALPPHKFSGWSFREIFAQAGVSAQSDGLFHLSDMANLIRKTPPFDSSETGLLSWRNLLP